MENRKKHSVLRKVPGYRTGTPWKMAVASIFYIMFIVAFIDVISEGPAPQNTNTEKPVKSGQQEPEPAFEWGTADITKENVVKALAGKTDTGSISMDRDFPESVREIEVISLGDGKHNIWIYYPMGSVWDETDLVKRAGGTAILAGSILYKNPNIEDVALFAEGEFTDQYGKSNVNTAVKIVLKRSLADQVDWKGLADRHVTDPGNIYRIVDNYSIHPGVFAQLKKNEVSL